MASVATIAEGRTWEPHEALLAVTFMQGSRRRLAAKLRDLEKQGIPVEVVTLDSWCLLLVRRFRRQLGLSGLVDVEPASVEWSEEEGTHSASFDAIRGAAIELLRKREVQAFIRMSFPLVIVDEFQDCDNTLVEVVELTTVGVTAFLAADEFQCLDDPQRGIAALHWLDENSDRTELTTIHRASNSALLNSARSLRDGVCTGGCIDVVSAPYGLAAWKIMTLLSWEGWSLARTVLLSPTGPESSTYVRRVLESLGKRLGKQKKLGPFNLSWCGTTAKQVDVAVSTLASAHHGAVLSIADIQSSDPLVAEALVGVRRRCGLRGLVSVSSEQLQQMLRKELNQLLAHGGLADKQGGIGLTVHGAKNREFRNIIALWPHALSGNAEHQRRLLYNAITRAQERAILLVEGKPDRLHKDQVLALLMSSSNQSPNGTAFNIQRGTKTASGTKTPWSGIIVGVHPRIGLKLVGGKAKHAYEGFVLTLKGSDNVASDFSVAIGKGAHQKHSFRHGNEVSGTAIRTDQERHGADYHRASKLTVHHRRQESASEFPCHTLAPPLEEYRRRGHSRMRATDDGSPCRSCVWYCRMRVERAPGHTVTEDHCYTGVECPFFVANVDATGPKTRD